MHFISTESLVAIDRLTLHLRLARPHHSHVPDLCFLSRHPVRSLALAGQATKLKGLSGFLGVGPPFYVLLFLLRSTDPVFVMALPAARFRTLVLSTT